MSQDVVDFGHVVAHVSFEIGDLIVGAFEGHALVEFDVLLDVKAPGEILHADVVDIEVVAGSDGADTVKDIFRALGARERLNGDVGVGKNFVDRGGDGLDELLGALKGNRTGEADGKVGEVAVARTADADATDFENTLDARDRVDDLGADTGGRGVEEGVNGAAGQSPAYGNDDSGDEESGDGIGDAEPIQAVGTSQQYYDKAEHDHAG